MKNITLHSRLQLLRRLVPGAFLTWEAAKSFYFIFAKLRDMKVALKVFFVLLQTHSSVIDAPLAKQRRVMWNVQHAHVGAANAAEYFSQPSTDGPEHQSWQRFEADRGFLGRNLFIIYPWFPSLRYFLIAIQKSIYIIGFFSLRSFTLCRDIHIWKILEGKLE